MKTFHVGNLVVQVDDSDFEYLSGVKWLESNGRINHPFRVNGKTFQISIAWFVVGRPIDRGFVDHIDGDPLNNQRSNLRYCSHAENMRNRKLQKNSKSRSKGVYVRSDRTGTTPNPWRAEIRANRKHVHLGSFATKEAASEAYRKAASVLHGPFARFK